MDGWMAPCGHVGLGWRMKGINQSSKTRNDDEKNDLHDILD